MKAMSSIKCAAIALSVLAFAASAADLPASLFLKESPAKADNVAELKKTVKAGDEVVMRGQIGGQAKDVFNASRSVFMLADMKMVPCNKLPGDKCETPWDFCCVPLTEKSANVALVQVTDEKGRPVKTTLKGVNGLDHLSVVVVKGKVKSNDAGNLLVNATGIYIEPKRAENSRAEYGTQRRQGSSLSHAVYVLAHPRENR